MAHKSKEQLINEMEELLIGINDSIGQKGPYTNLQNIEARIIYACHQLENDLIKNVLRQLLNREPTNEDAKHCTMAYEEKDSFTYILAYENLILGTVSKIYNMGDYSVKFTPSVNSELRPILQSELDKR